jgi:hypothetical protein
MSESLIRKPFKTKEKSREETLSLLRLEAALGLVDHIDAALAAHDAAVFVTVFQGLKRRTDFHDGAAFKSFWVIVSAGR